MITSDVQACTGCRVSRVKALAGTLLSLSAVILKSHSNFLGGFLLVSSNILKHCLLLLLSCHLLLPCQLGSLSLLGLLFALLGSSLLSLEGLFLRCLLCLLPCP